jgi:large subunit ribosomal protein L23
VSAIEASKNHRDIVLKPVVTEKSSVLMDHGKYTFEVDPRATKTEIKIAIEQIFGVKVGAVATQNRKGKAYRTRDGIGRRKDVKRAIVTLREGTIDIFGEQASAR